MLENGLVKLGVVRLDLDALILAELNLWIQGDVEGIGQDLVLGDVNVLDGGTADHAQIGLGESRLEGGISEILNRLFKEDLLAVHALDHRAGRLALAEAGDIKILLVSLIDLVDCLFEIGSFHGGLERRSVVLFLFDVLDIHWFVSS